MSEYRWNGYIPRTLAFTVANSFGWYISDSRMVGYIYINHEAGASDSAPKIE
jgi:hypothetical protein